MQMGGSKRVWFCGRNCRFRWRWLLSKENCYINCVSHNDLLRIAEIIKSIIYNIEIYHSINQNNSNYSADSEPFKQALKSILNKVHFQSN